MQVNDILSKAINKTISIIIMTKVKKLNVFKVTKV